MTKDAQISEVGDARRDWSGLMARAQDGDRDAYRTLLEDMVPYLRALAARRFKEPGDMTMQSRMCC